MRNGKYDISVRMTETEKERLNRLHEFCKVPKRTILYWLVKDMPIGQRSSDDFFKLHRLSNRLRVNICHLWLNRNLPNDIKTKYYHYDHRFNKAICNAMFKTIFKDPYYGENEE